MARGGVMEFCAIGFLLVVTVISSVEGEGRCSAHCDIDGYYQRAFYCSRPGEEFCCGSRTQRTCCGNSTMDITGKYDDVYVCERSSWWLYHWQIIIGLLGTIIVLLLVAACCCQCCGVCKKPASRQSGRIEDPEVNTVSSEIDGDADAQRMQTFDPNHPFAFNPPDYDSLPKEPPKYEEIYLEGGGVANPAFAGETSTSGGSDQSAGNSSERPPQVNTICLSGIEGQGGSGQGGSGQGGSGQGGSGQGGSGQGGSGQGSSGQGSSGHSPRSPSSIQFTAHGIAPLEELPPYEVAILEPSSSRTVNCSAAAGTGADRGVPGAPGSQGGAAPPYQTHAPRPRSTIPPPSAPNSGAATTMTSPSL